MTMANECEPDIAIGDLVHLRDDSQLRHGIGLILDRREDTADIIKDFIAKLGIDEADNELNDALAAANKYLVNTTVYLVHWQGGESKTLFRNIWMFYSEIQLLSKVNTPHSELRREEDSK